MYYDRNMKKTLFAFCVCFLSVWVGAQVTCESRVDAHPHATTKQRINYCLTNSDETPSGHPGLVFSGVTTYQPAEQTATQKPSAAKGPFNPDKITVQRSFIGTQQFPPFTNETLSEREIWQLHQQNEQQPVPSVLGQVRQPVEKQMSPLSEQIVETKAGLKVRQTKPGRRLYIDSAQTSSSAVTDLSESATQQVVAPADAYTYDSTQVQPYTPAVSPAQEYVPAMQDAQEYTPVEQTDQAYMPAEQEEIPVGVASYAPAN